MLFENRTIVKVKWISVTDRLPGTWFTVIATDTDGMTDVAWIDEKGEWMTTGYESTTIPFKNITHWCVLPKSPNS